MQKIILSLTALAITSIVSCGRFKSDANTQDSLQVAPSEVEAFVNPPYYKDSTASNIYHMYGMISPYSKADYIDKSLFPNIPNLSFNSCMEYCHKDYCKSIRAVLAVSCSEDEYLLSWSSKKACEFANMFNNTISQNPSLRSGAEICNYYIDELRKDFQEYVKDCSHEEGALCEQRGRLIADVLQIDNLHTFIISDWYDFLSCGDNSTISYITIDSLTGKEVKYSDLIERADEHKLGTLLLKYLRNETEGWIEKATNLTQNTGYELLSKMSGCALLKEGLIIYFHPYTIGQGAEGQFIAIIPYNILNANNIRFKVPYNIVMKSIITKSIG